MTREIYEENQEIEEILQPLADNLIGDIMRVLNFQNRTAVKYL
ncbi:hypothetical protein [Radiobacillus sp. PE A8.2]